MCLVTFESIDGEWLGDIPCLQIYSFGDTPAEVGADLIEQIESLDDFIKSRKVEDLGRSFLAWKDYLDLYKKELISEVKEICR